MKGMLLQRSTPQFCSALLIMVISLAQGCRSQVPPELLLYGFESDNELDSVDWKCHTLFAISEEHNTQGRKALRMELYPSQYPGLAPQLKERDWSGYRSLSFDIFNPSDSAVNLSLRIDDRKDYPKYGDRYNNRFVLNPGMNHISLPLDTLRTSSTGQKLNLRNIRRLIIFVARPQAKTVLFVDNIRLMSGGRDEGVAKEKITESP